MMSRREKEFLDLTDNELTLDCKALKANPLTVNSQDLWLAKDNRFLNPKISYERILMAPPCRLIKGKKSHQNQARNLPVKE